MLHSYIWNCVLYVNPKVEISALIILWGKPKITMIVFSLFWWSYVMSLCYMYIGTAAIWTYFCFNSCLFLVICVIKIRVQAIRGLPLFCKDTPEHISKIVDILAQLLIAGIFFFTFFFCGAVVWSCHIYNLKNFNIFRRKCGTWCSP